MNYSKITPYDVANGIGVRTSIFVSGCSFHCKGCFNTEAQDFFYGTPVTDETISFLNECVQDPRSAGLSILGGDPLWQNEYGISQLIELCGIAHRYNKNVWLWSGFKFEDIIQFEVQSLIGQEPIPIKYFRKELIKNVDVLVDGQFIEAQKDPSLPYRGSSNQRVIDVKKSLQKGQVVLWC